MNIKINLGWVFSFVLLWCFFIREITFPRVLPETLTFLLPGIIIFLFYWFYRMHSATIAISLRFLAAFICFTMTIAFLNRGILESSLAVDQLYHAEKSAFMIDLFRQYFLPAVSQNKSMIWIADKPASHVLEFFGALVLLVAILTALLFRYIRRLRFGDVIFLIGLIACGYALSQCLTNRTEPHPPFRLFPLFLGQLVFGFNELGFRLPGLIATGAIATCLFRFLEKKGVPLLFAIVGTLAIISMPTVLYSSSLVEPSIWMFVAYLGVFLLVSQFLDTDNDAYLVFAAGVIAVSSQMRQNTVALWPIIPFLLLVKRRPLKTWLLTLAPVMISLLYFVTISQTGRPASFSMYMLRQSLYPIEPIRRIFYTSGLGWIAFAVFALFSLLIYARSLLFLSQLLLIIPTYFLFHCIDDFLWDIGRYQVEYIAPFFAILLSLSVIYFHRRYSVLIFASMLFLISQSIQIFRTFPHDIAAQGWNKRRVASNPHLFLGKALDVLRESRSGGRFICLCSAIPDLSLNLYMHGFSFEDVATHRSLQTKTPFESLDTPDKLAQFIISNNIDFVLVQSGAIQEYRHNRDTRRPVPVSIALLEGLRQKDFPLVSVGKFFGQTEGAAEVLAVKQFAWRHSM